VSRIELALWYPLAGALDGNSEARPEFAILALGAILRPTRNIGVAIGYNVRRERKQLNGAPVDRFPHGRFCHCRNCWNSCSFSASVDAGVFNFSELRERGEVDAPVVSDRCALEAL
jgi:hypothetical protein